LRLVLSTIFLILVVAYLASFWLPMPDWLASVKGYSEALLIAFAIFSLSILSVQHIAAKIFSRRNELTSKALADLLRAHIYITRVVIFVVAVGFPLFVYYNINSAWGISDAVIVAIPTILLAMVIAEQNVHTYLTARVEKAGEEKARIAPIYEAVKGILAETSHDKMPQDRLLDALSERLLRVESATGEPSFAMCAARSHTELCKFRKAGVSEDMRLFLEDMKNKLHEYSSQ